MHTSLHPNTRFTNIAYRTITSSCTLSQKTGPGPGLIDIKVTARLPREGLVDPEALAMLTLLGEIARGTDDLSTRPEARMHDPATMKAGCISKHADIWEHYILPNSNHSPAVQAAILKQVKHGIDWKVYANDTAFSKANTQVHHENNHNIVGNMPDGFTSQEDFITKTIDGYVKMNALKPVPRDGKQPQVISPLFVDTKKPKGRLITDCRWQNTRQRPPKFKLQTLNEFRRAITPGSLMFKIDLVAGYLHVGIAEESQDVFGIRWKEQSYVFTAANFGSNSTPFIFQRLTAAVGTALQRLGISSCVYLDDMLFVCLPATTSRSAAQRAEDTVFIVKEVLYLCGFVLNREKSVLIGTTQIESLGFGIDSIAQTFCVLPHRRDSIVALAKELGAKEHITMHEMQSFTGKAVSLTLAVPAIKFYLGPLWDSLADVRYNMIRATPLIREALAEFTAERVNKWGRIARWRPEAHVSCFARVATDAAGGTSITEKTSGNGWGCGIYPPNSSTADERQGRFDPQHQDEPIVVKESLGILYGLRESGLSDCFATAYTDNTNVYDAMRKYSTKTAKFRPFVRAVIDFMIDNNVAITFEWVPSHMNPVADRMSRTNPVMTADAAPSPADAMLHPDICRATQEWAEFTCDIDAMASPANRQTRVFISRQPYDTEDCIATDLFAAGTLVRSAYPPTGNPPLLWVHPPWPIISALWAFLRANGARGIFIIPHFPDQPWFDRIMHQAKRVTRIACKGDNNTYLSTRTDGAHVDSAQATVDLYALTFEF